MNRHSFISNMLKAGVACAFLPGACRLWKPVYRSVPVPLILVRTDCFGRRFYNRSVWLDLIRSPGAWPHGMGSTTRVIPYT